MTGGGPPRRSPLRDLSQKIEEVSRGHPAWSQAHIAVLHLVDYLNALAFMEEGRERERRLQQLEAVMSKQDHEDLKSKVWVDGTPMEAKDKKMVADTHQGAPAILKTGPTDKELAADIRRKMAAALGDVGGIMDEADEKGLSVSFQIGKDFRGKNVIVGLVVSRPL